MLFFSCSFTTWHCCRDLLQQQQTLKYWVGVQWDQSYLIGRRCFFKLGWPPFSDGITIKNALCSRCFTTSSSLRPCLFLLGWLKLNSILLLHQLKLAQGQLALAFLELTGHLEDTGCFLVALCHLIVRRPNLEVATKRLLHQLLKILGWFQCHVFA